MYAFTESVSLPAAAVTEFPVTLHSTSFAFIAFSIRTLSSQLNASISANENSFGVCAFEPPFEEPAQHGFIKSGNPSVSIARWNISS